MAEINIKIKKTAWYYVALAVGKIGFEKLAFRIVDKKKCWKFKQNEKG